MSSIRLTPRVADVSVGDVSSSATAASWLRGTSPGSLAIAWLLGLAPPAHRALAEQMVRYSAVGGVCTALFSVLYLVLAPSLGNALANTVAMVVTAVLNTGLNRRHTFRAGRSGAARHHAQGLVILALTWVLSTGSLAGLRVLIPAAAHVTELLVLTGANLGGTLMRFVLLRTWVFGRPGAAHR